MLIQELPKTCPRCGDESSGIRQSHRKMQLKAVVMIWLGIFLVIPWAAVIFLVYHNSDTIVIPVGPIGGIIALVIVSSPAIIFAFTGANLRKAVDVKCVKCDWKKRFLIDKPTRPVKHP